MAIAPDLSMTVTIGFVINPIAGMGGTVGLKGTDGLMDEALRRGAVPRAGIRAREMLTLLPGHGLRILTCGGEMGESVLREAGIRDYRIVHEPADPSTAADTRAACRAFGEEGVDLILFCGGDGTARDVLDAVGRRVPVLGVPAGVKMYSGVFATRPATAAEIISHIADLPLREAEVMDVDEDAYREGRLSTRLYGYATVPYLPGRVQGGKCVFESRDEDRAREEIARFIAEIMVPG
ncbi:MAG: ATP-NAD kinase family protein, partial [Methanoculleaceae archaeon]